MSRLTPEVDIFYDTSYAREGVLSVSEDKIMGTVFEHKREDIVTYALC
jgi:hypothetical protein